MYTQLWPRTVTLPSSDSFDFKFGDATGGVAATQTVEDMATKVVFNLPDVPDVPDVSHARVAASERQLGEQPGLFLSDPHRCRVLRPDADSWTQRGLHHWAV